MTGRCYGRGRLRHGYTKHLFIFGCSQTHFYSTSALSGCVVTALLLLSVKQIFTYFRKPFSPYIIASHGENRANTCYRMARLLYVVSTSNRYRKIGASPTCQCPFSPNQSRLLHFSPEANACVPRFSSVLHKLPI